METDKKLTLNGKPVTEEELQVKKKELAKKKGVKLIEKKEGEFVTLIQG